MANFGISTEWKEELKSRNDIVSTISHYIKLERKGKSYWGLCPFHYEKTPSFCVNEIDQFYKCFGCGESGDVIKFVEKYEGVDFMEALKILAKNVGMEMPEFEKNSDIAKKKEEKDQVLQALRQAALFYCKILNDPNRGKLGRDYLARRGISEKSIRSFGIGFSPDFESMKNELVKQGFSLDTLKKAGLIDTSENGRVFDAFGGRLIFPLINSYNEVIGFSARLIEDKPFAKYKNSAQGIVFDKSHVVFAINILKKLRNELHANIPRVIIVEGQIDVISMHDAGFTNTVACLGTAITPLHAKEIKKMTDTAILLLDGDGAGQKATLRSIDVLRPSGLSVKVATLPNGCDPDEFLKKYKPEDMKKLLDSAIEGIDFQLQVLAKSYDLTSNEQKAKFIKSALAIINNLETDAEKSIYLDTIRKLTSIPVDVLRQDLNNIKSENLTPTQHEESAKIESNLETDAFILADKFILASLLNRKSWASLTDCTEVTFLLPDAKILFEYIQQGTADKPALIGGVFDRIDVPNSPFTQGVINYAFSEDTAPVVWKDCLLKNKQRQLLMQKDKLDAELFRADINQRKILAKQLFDIDIQLAKIKNKISK